MNNQDSNYFIPVLSAIAGLGAIVTVFSPLLFQNDQISRLFIDPGSIQFVSIFSIIIAVFTIWYASSTQSYQSFPGNNNVLIRLIIGLIILSILFYGLKFIAQTHYLNESFASVLQYGTYIFAYFLLSIIVGLLLRDSFGAYRFQKIQQEKYSLIRETLFKAGLLEAKLEIIAVAQRPFNQTPQYMGLNQNVIFENSKGKFFAVMSNEFDQVVDSWELKDEPTDTTDEK